MEVNQEIFTYNKETLKNIVNLFKTLEYSISFQKIKKFFGFELIIDKKKIQN